MTYDLINNPNVWVIAGLAVILGVLVGMLLTVGGRRKWKERYQDEVQTRESWQAEHERLSQERVRCPTTFRKQFVKHCRAVSSRSPACSPQERPTAT